MTGGLLVKVCGMTRDEDVETCAALGVDFLGFIFHPKSPRNTTPGFAARFAEAPFMRGVERVGLFLSQTADEARRIMDEGRLTLAQLHGGQDEEFCRAIEPERVIKVFWPERYGELKELEADLERFKDVCRYYLFDAGTSGGGHGRSMDFGRLGGLASPRPWLLAGGLGPDNALDAARACSPAGLDLNSGVESSPGIKDRDKIAAVLARLGTLNEKGHSR